MLRLPGQITTQRLVASSFSIAEAPRYRAMFRDGATGTSARSSQPVSCPQPLTPESSMSLS
eukprot:4265934-Alexandrium_andersonii.AAC.1